MMKKKKKERKGEGDELRSETREKKEKKKKRERKGEGDELRSEKKKKMRERERETKRSEIEKTNGGGGDVGWGKSKKKGGVRE